MKKLVKSLYHYTTAAHYNCIYSRQKKYYSIKAFLASFPYQGVTIAAHSLGANKEATVTLPWWGRERELNSFDRYIYQIIFFSVQQLLPGFWHKKHRSDLQWMVRSKNDVLRQLDAR